MEVDVDGTLSYPEPQMTANDNGKDISGNLTPPPGNLIDSILSSKFLIALKLLH